MANYIAATSVSYVLESVLCSDVDDCRYSLDTEADKFEDNFVEALEELGLIVTESRIDVISKCFEKQLERIKNTVSLIVDKQYKKYKLDKELKDLL